jgi:hypothetical protein
MPSKAVYLFIKTWWHNTAVHSCTCSIGSQQQATLSININLCSCQRRPPGDARVARPLSRHRTVYLTELHVKPVLVAAAADISATTGSTDERSCMSLQFKLRGTRSRISSSIFPIMWGLDSNKRRPQYSISDAGPELRAMHKV